MVVPASHFISLMGIRRRDSHVTDYGFPKPYMKAPYDALMLRMACLMHHVAIVQNGVDATNAAEVLKIIGKKPHIICWEVRTQIHSHPLFLTTFCQIMIKPKPSHSS